LPTNNGGYNATGHGKTHPKVYSELTTDNPIDLTRYQVLNSYNGRIGVINSGGASTGNDANDLSEAVLTAVVNKRAGGQGLILGRKAFQKEYNDGIASTSRRTRRLPERRYYHRIRRRINFNVKGHSSYR